MAGCRGHNAPLRRAFQRKESGRLAGSLPYGFWEGRYGEETAPHGGEAENAGLAVAAQEGGILPVRIFLMGKELTVKNKTVSDFQTGNHVYNSRMQGQDIALLLNSPP